MYNNSGKKLGTLLRTTSAMLLIAIGLAGSYFVYKFSTIRSWDGQSETSGARLLLGLLILGAVMWLVWASFLFLIGMSDMMSDVYAIRKIAEKYEMILEAEKLSVGNRDQNVMMEASGAETAVRRCKKCGGPLEADDIFCGDCGTKVEEVEELEE